MLVTGPVRSDPLARPHGFMNHVQYPGGVGDTPPVRRAASLGHVGTGRTMGLGCRALSEPDFLIHS